MTSKPIQLRRPRTPLSFLYQDYLAAQHWFAEALRRVHSRSDAAALRDLERHVIGLREDREAFDRAGGEAKLTREDRRGARMLVFKGIDSAKSVGYRCGCWRCIDAARSLAQQGAS